MIKSSSDYNFKFNGESDKPLYLSIAEIIANDIEKGYLQKNLTCPLLMNSVLNILLRETQLKKHTRN